MFILQLMQSLCCSSDWYVPGMQSKQVVLPLLAWWRPVVQRAHSSPLAGFGDALPTAHFTQLVCSFFVWYFPGIQFKQPVMPSCD
jgi:hypothetical protein